MRLLKDIVTIIGLAVLALGVLATGAVLFGRSRTGAPVTEKGAPAHLFSASECEASGCTYVQNGGIVELFDGLVQCRLLGFEGWHKARSCFIQNMFDGKCTFHRCTPPNDTTQSDSKENE